MHTNWKIINMQIYYMVNLNNPTFISKYLKSVFQKLTQSISTHFEIITFLFSLLFMNCVFIAIHEKFFWLHFNSKLLNT